MRNLINIIEENESALRGEWYVLSWNGEGWNWSDGMSESDARSEYNKQLRVMPNCPAKMVCVAQYLEYPGENASALSVSVRKS